MTVLNPLDNEDLYDVLELGGVESPGVVTLSGHDRKVTWDVKGGSAQQGATTTLKEIPPIEFTASFYLVDRDDFEDWPRFLAVIESTVKGSKPQAVDIYHPDLASQSPPILSVVKAKVSGVKHDGRGGQTITVTFQEYHPPKPKGGSPSGSKPKENDPNAAANAEIAALTAQYQVTPWHL